MRTVIEPVAPATLAEANLQPRGSVHPSPSDWRDQVLYFLLPDRFSDGGEDNRPLFSAAQPDQFRAPDKRAWMQAGKVFQGGTLRGIISKLDYLRDLGITCLWIGPVWKQRADLETYHGYGIQNFLDVDPRFGTRQDLRDLVDEAHRRGLYVLLDIIYNHTGNNWFYNNNGRPWNTMPYRFQPPYPVYGWRSGTGQPISQIATEEDGVWPREFQDLRWYSRAGQIRTWDPAEWEDPLHPENEFRRGDFFDLKSLDLNNPTVLSAVIRVYQYWIALSDCDGFRIDTVKHVSWEASRRFCGAIHEYAEAIGKENFLLLGEVTGGEYLARSYLEIAGRNLDAVLDIGPARKNLVGLAKGLKDPRAFFDQFKPYNVLGSHRETGRYHVSILDDHDMVGSPKARFAAGVGIPTGSHQVAHAVGIQLTTLGIPCIYYGTEQALDGSESRHDFTVEPERSFEDRYIREALFGALFGAFETSGCHFFDPDHPTYLRIAAIARLRQARGMVGLTLRRGRQYLREIAHNDSAPFAPPRAGELVAWSRIQFSQEVVVVLNTHGLERRAALVTVDFNLSPVGTKLRVLYNSKWPPSALRSLRRSETVVVQSVQGRAAVAVELAPAGMMILA